MKQKVHTFPKIGIVIGDTYGREDFRTDVKDPVKAIEEANEHIRHKYGPGHELGIISQHKKIKAR